MSHHDDNLYTILGRLAALQPKPEIKTSKEAAKKIYESVEARGSILSGVDTVQAKLAKQFAMERDESKLKKGHCSDCDCSPCRCKKCNECGVLESKCRCKPDMTEGHCPQCDCSPCECNSMEEASSDPSRMFLDRPAADRYRLNKIGRANRLRDRYQRDRNSELAGVDPYPDSRHTAPPTAQYQQASRDGTKAHLAGEALSTNPYPKGTDDHNAWWTAWTTSSTTARAVPRSTAARVATRSTAAWQPT